MTTALVIVERSSGGIRRASLEALGKARSLGLSTVALVAGSDPSAAARAASAHADRVLAAAHPDLERYDAEAHVALAERVTRDVSPSLVLGPATSTGRDLVARLSARLGAGYAAEITDITIDPDGRPTARRAVHGGKAVAVVAFEGPPPWLATVRPGAFPTPSPGAAGKIEMLHPALPEIRTRVVSFEEAGGKRVHVTEAEIVISGGRGLGDPAAFTLIERLADRLGAAVGASRAVVDAGWRDASEQVGKSGNTVAPRLYVAFGVSGAVHHVMGMAGAGTVVVVNRDPAAPFFKHADHGLVVLPALLEELGA